MQILSSDSVSLLESTMSTKKQEQKAVKKIAKMNLEELNARYNPNVIIPNKIKAALKEVGNAAVAEDELRKLTGLNANQLAQFRAEFENYLIPVRDPASRHPRYLWAGTPEFAAAAREELVR